MADAFGDELFNVFDEDGATGRPTPDINIAQDSLEQKESDECDDNKR